MRLAASRRIRLSKHEAMKEEEACQTSPQVTRFHASMIVSVEFRKKRVAVCPDPRLALSLYQPLSAMLALFALLSSLLLALQVSASALTTTIPAHDRSCFYAAVDKPGEKVCSRSLRLYSGSANANASHLARLASTLL